MYAVPLGLALLYLLLYAISGVTFGDADGDVEAHDGLAGEMETDADLHDAGIESDADADAEVEAEAGHEIEHDAESDGDHAGVGAHEFPLHIVAMRWLGIGRIPVSLVLMLVAMTWGAIGLMTSLMTAAGGFGGTVYSVPAALFGSLLVTHLVGRLIVRYLPLNETYARRRHDLLGRSGEAVFAIDEKFGMVAVRDGGGNLFAVPCRSDAGVMIAKGQRVKLTSYHNEGYFGVFAEARPQAARPPSPKIEQENI